MTTKVSIVEKSIQQRLIDLSEKLRGEDGHLTQESLDCQNASTLYGYVSRIKSDRWISHFNAALTGLLTSLNDYSYDEIIRGATRIADMATQAIPDFSTPISEVDPS
jgi:hypothetical protein